MEEVIMKESFISACKGKKLYAVRLFKRWIIYSLGGPGTLGVGVCVTVKLLSDRLKFSLSFPLCFLPCFKFEIPFTDIESIEFRKHFFKQGIFTLIPKLKSDNLICITVRAPELWLESFEMLGLRVEHIE